MKLRFSFTFKILLPYLALAAIFFLIFLSEFQEGGTLIAWLAAIGLLLSFLFGIFNNLWLKKPINRIRKLVVSKFYVLDFCNYWLCCIFILDEAT